jgi:hypothetical protein
MRAQWVGLAALGIVMDLPGFATSGSSIPYLHWIFPREGPGWQAEGPVPLEFFSILPHSRWQGVVLRKRVFPMGVWGDCILCLLRNERWFWSLSGG